jgi:hypothetical protein
MANRGSDDFYEAKKKFQDAVKDFFKAGGSSDEMVEYIDDNDETE